MKNSPYERMGGYVMAHHLKPQAGETCTAWAVTVSREAGAGGTSVAQRLAAFLDANRAHDEPSWVVHDHNTILEEALEKHRMPAHYAQYLPEAGAHFVPDTIEDLLGLHPAASEMVRHLAETMVNVARRGNVILVGRAGNCITARLPNVVHVRLVAPLGERVRHIERLYQLSKSAATDYVAKTDRARKRFLRQNFGARIDDAAAYDLVLNTARLGFEESAKIIGALLLDRMVEGIAGSKARGLAGAGLSEL